MELKMINELLKIDIIEDKNSRKMEISLINTATPRMELTFLYYIGIFQHLLPSFFN